MVRPTEGLLAAPCRFVRIKGQSFGGGLLSGHGKKEREERPRHRRDAAELDRPAQTCRRGKEADSLQAGDATQRGDDRYRGFGRRASACGEELTRPRSENRRARAGEAAPQHIAGEKSDRPCRKAEARRRGGGDRERGCRNATSEPVRQVTPREIRKR